MKKTIQDFDLNNKKVIIRVDFNVPLKGKKILNDNRIKQSLETINYAIEHNAKVILLSHLGRIKTEADKKNKSLAPVSKRLSKLLNKKVIFSKDTRGEKLENKINKMKNKDVLLIENTRFEDLNDKAESKNNEELGKYWASLGDIFINDAFATSHRSHASNVGIAINLESGIGFLIEKELTKFDLVLNNPKKPTTLMLGGAKVGDKIGLIENLIDKVDYVLIGGGMAYTFIKASGLSIGKSLLEEEKIDFCKKILEDYPDKIILPIDSVLAKDLKSKVTKEVFINEIEEDDMALDIGYKTYKLFKEHLEISKTVIWNGTLGMTEIDKYAVGSIKVCEALKNIEAYKLVGGGDTAGFVINNNYEDIFDHISTGGGASLELLSGSKLPGIESIDEK